MPQIREYTSRVSVQGPVSGGQLSPGDLFQANFQGLGQGLASLGEVLHRRREQAEVSDLTAKVAEAQAEWSVHLQERLRTAEPGTDITEPFMAELDDYLARLGEQAETRGGRQYLQVASARLRGHFLQSVAAGQAELAGAKAKQDAERALNGFTSALINDPSAFEMNLALHNEGVDHLVEAGLLSRATAEKWKTAGATEMAKAAVRGWIELDPDLAKEQLNEGRWDGFVGGDLKNQLLGEADQAIRARELEAERLRVAAERQEKQARIATQNDFLAKMAAGELTTEEILQSNLMPFGSGSKEQFLNMLEKANKADGGSGFRTDPGTYLELFRRIHLPPDDPDRIVDENFLNAFLGRGLTFEDLNELRGEIQGKRTQAGEIEADLKKGLLDVAKSTLTGTNQLLGIRDPQGDAQLQRFTAWFLQEYKRQIEQGKTPIQLLDPESPDYLGKAIERFRRSPQQMFRDLIDNNVGMGEDELLPAVPGSSRRNPATPQTQADFDALPPGAWFVNPADQRVMQKAQ